MKFKGIHIPRPNMPPLASKICWWGVFTLNVVLAICTVIAGYAGNIDPHTWALPAMLALTFPMWMILTVVSLVVCLLFSWKLALVPGVSLLLCIGPMISNSPLNFVNPKVTDSNRDRTFRLLSFNTAQAYDMRDSWQHGKEDGDGRAPCNPTLTWIMAQDADVVCLQEFPKILRPDPRLRITQEQIDSMNRHYPHHTATWAESIFSKYPLYQIEFKHREREYEPYTAAVAEIQGHKTLIISVHLDSFGLNDEDKELYSAVSEGKGGSKNLKAARRILMPKMRTTFCSQTTQARIIRNLIDSLAIDNVIVTGDFNNVPDSYPIRVISGKDMKNSFNEAGLGPIITFHKNRFYFHIDHTLYRGQMQAIGFERGDVETSDHYPIITTFEWHSKAPGYRDGMPQIDLINRDDIK